MKKLLSLSAALTGALAISCSMPSSIVPTFHGSIGMPHNGFLTDAVELPKEGKGYKWRSAADHHFGLPRMIAMLEEATARVADARPNGVPIFVGEISNKTGGQLMPKHRSHRTGRDVDVMLFVTSLEGVPLPNPAFVKIGADGIGVAPGGRFVRLDVDREWLFIKSVVESKHVHVQWIFFARWLEALVIEHAIALGEDPHTIAMAEQVLQQPGDSLPHDDHTHVRLACEADEYATGCDGGGPLWAWIPRANKVEAPEAEIFQALVGPSVVVAPPTELASK